MSEVTAVRERPILFSGPMVKAILKGRKSQTRRVVKPQPTKRVVEGLGGITKGMNPADDGAVWYDADGIGPGREMRCPYGRVGERLWVRESFAVIDDRGLGGERYVEYRADSDATHPGGWDNAPDDPEALKWKPSIHMPRWASRLTLELTDVHVQRLQDIRYGDVIREGLDYWLTDEQQTDGPHMAEARADFAKLWDALNKKRGYSWESNPWVWCLSFRRVDP